MIEKRKAACARIQAQATTPVPKTTTLPPTTTTLPQRTPLRPTTTTLPSTTTLPVWKQVPPPKTCAASYQEVMSGGQPGDCQSSSMPECYPCAAYSTEECASKCDKAHSCASYSYSSTGSTCRLYKHEPATVWL